ncbi:MAG: phosphopantetheine-binding protein [Elusimicrobia bacterium]|nr:phosphopantetheine-binding protein [Elusimicrobiota bacterium]
MRKTINDLVMDVLKRKKVAVKPGMISEGVSMIMQLGIDSLDILQIVATAEKKFGIQIPDEELKKIDDMGSFLKAVENNWPKD